SDILVRAGSSSFTLEPRIRLGKRQLDALMASFVKKVDLIAQYETAHPLSRHKKVPRENWTVLRIAHRYRNAIYHRDSHNPALVGILARLMLQATCSLFVSTQAGHWGTSDGQRQLGDLNRYELTDEHGMLWPQKAAEQFTTLVTQGLGVAL